LVALIGLLSVLPSGRVAAQTVDGGHSHTIVATPDGRVFTWGYNASGQLGDGTTTQRPLPTEIVGLTGAVGVAGGLSHTLVLKNDGTVWAFGANTYGQLGDGTVVTRLTPVQVQGLDDIVSVAAGWNYSLALAADGTVWAWGQNNVGQFCTGTTTNSAVPVYVSALSASTAIRAGGEHTVALRSDGTVLACGGNGRGQLGDGTTVARAVPVTVTGIASAAGLDAGDYHTLVLLQDGTVRAVGGNDRGQLGDGTATDRSTPVTASGLSGVAAVHAGALHSLARTATGEVYVWGYNVDGQVGDGTMYVRRTPTRTQNTPAVTLAAAAGYHNVLVTATGVVRAWAWNGRGQVGDGTLTNRVRPVVISGENYAWLTTSPAISPVSGTYTSPRTVTMTTTTPSSVIRYTTDGTEPSDTSAAYTAPLSVGTGTTLKAATFRAGWQPGATASATYAFNYGTLSAPVISPTGGSFTTSAEVTMTAAAGSTIRYTLDGTDPNGASAVYTAPLVVDTSRAVKARAFRVDYTTSAAVTAAFTIAVAAPTFSRPSGSYAAGDLVALLDATPDAVLRYTIHGADPTESDPGVWPGGALTLGNYTLKVRAYKVGCTPSAVVSASYTVTGAGVPPSVAGGDSRSIVLAPDGTVWAWGYNLQGAVGDGSTTNRSLPVRVVGLTGMTAVASGSNFAFAVAGDGRAFAWGENQSWLGDGTTTNRSRPVAVLGLTDAAHLASQWRHSLAMRADGTAWSWGKNGYGELGDGTTTARSAPVSVAGRTMVVSVASGRFGSSALTADGHVWGWGDNGSGTIGDGTTTSRLTPVQAVGLPTVVALAAGAYHRLALAADGTVWAWGANDFGQLGDDTLTGRATPAPVPGLAGIVRIAAAGWRSYAIDGAGTLWGWGANTNGELGDGTTTSRRTPVSILGNVTTVGGGPSHTLAVTSDGTVWTWGSNGTGELGDGTTIARAWPAAISGPGMRWRTATPVFSLASGTFTSTQTVTVTCADPDAVLHYTTTGADPTEGDPVIVSGGTLPVGQSLTLKVVGWKPGAPPSVVAAAAYELKVIMPTVTPATGTYSAPLGVTMTTATTGTTLRYTLDGSEPAPSSPVSAGTLSLGHTATVKVRAYRDGWTPSDAGLATYAISAGALAPPMIAPSGGALREAAYVTITASSPTATIRYTLDGSTPTPSSAWYRYPSYVLPGTTLRARCFEDGHGASTVTDAVFTHGDPSASEIPQVSPAGGVFASQRVVTVIAPVDAVLRYTTSGADPTEADAIVPAGRTITVARSLVLKVRAWRPGLLASAVRRADFTVTGAVSAGRYHVLALHADGTVWAWGANGSGQLGDGTNLYRGSPVHVLNLTEVVAVAAGNGFSLAVKRDGTVWSWGANASGQLGDGTTSARLSPVPVTGLPAMTAIAAGDAHALAVAADGSVWAWGQNGFGQLGDGTSVDRTHPVAVLGLTGVTAVAAGNGFSVALETGGAHDGQAWTWGVNSSGQLGEGTTTTRTFPVHVAGMPPVQAVAAMRDAAIALAADGTVWTWGANTTAQLGTPGGTRTTPAAVPGMPAATQVAAGDGFAAALDAHGTAWAWGSNDQGQFGLPSNVCGNWTTQYACPMPVRLPWSNTLGVTLSRQFSTTVRLDGTVWSAGVNAAGQLGTGTWTASQVQVPISGFTLADNAWLTTDADGDGLSTWEELLGRSDPLNADTNGNGIPDAIEAASRASAANPDTDGDGVPDAVEVARGTDPFVADTDGDGVNDRLDAYPLDPTRSQAPTPMPGDVTPPTITLTEPLNARWIR
jgi:alpha-tubulin suppressor-like RCC1 family protein